MTGRPNIFLALLALGTCAAALGLEACSDRAPTAPPAPEYVGAGVCAECHADQLELWTGSHHDLAMQEATPETVLADFDGTSHEHFGVTTTFSQREGRFFARTDGPDGELVEYEIAYVFGVDPLQQYLVEFPGGRMQALPLAWDTRPAEDGGARWFHLYPDESIPAGDELHWTGPNQNWNYMCAECHSTDLSKGYDLASDSYDTKWFEIDVSCEACHGPGSRHVWWAESEDDPDVDDLGLTHSMKDHDGGRWVIDVETGNATRSPARGARTEIDTCAPCHSRRSPIVASRAPGDPFLDGYRPSLLEDRLYHADGQIREEVYVYGSFLQSRMYGLGVTCGDCHEPHSLRLRFEGDSLCSQCHYAPKYESPDHHHHPPDSAGARCVECHMPARDYMVVDPRRDHSLRVPRPDLSVQLGTPNACTGCHTDQSSRWAADAWSEWYGDPAERPPHYARAFHAARRGSAEAEPLLARVVGDPEAAGIVRATALAELARYVSGNSIEVVRAALEDEDPLVRFGALRALDEVGPRDRATLAAALLEDPVRLVRLEAARLFASVPARGGAIDRAFAEYRAAQLVNAERPESHLNLGTFEVDRGVDLGAAETAYRTALRLAPGFIEAYLNLADLQRRQERDGDAEKTLREALEIAPENGYVHHALGLVLVRLDRRVEAVDSLARAAELQPEVARFAYVYGISVHDQGDVRRGLEVLEEALVRHPRDRALLRALATMHRDAGSLDLALRRAERLAELEPGDPGVRGLVEEIRELRDR